MLAGHVRLASPICPRTGAILLSDMSNQPTLEDWLTKQQAAQFLGVAEKTVDRMANSGEIQKATRKQPGRPPMVVFHPDDVGRARAARQQVPPPFVMPNGAGTAVQPMSRTVVQPASDFDVHRTVDVSPGHVGQAVGRMSTLPPSELAHKLWLTEDEAVRYTGLGRGYLERKAKAERIGPRGALVYRRKDLDAL